MQISRGLLVIGLIDSIDTLRSSAANIRITISYYYAAVLVGCIAGLSRPSVRLQGDHLSGKPGKPGNVREFETCQGNVRDVVNSQGIVREMSGKKSCQGKIQ